MSTTVRASRKRQMGPKASKRAKPRVSYRTVSKSGYRSLQGKENLNRMLAYHDHNEVSTSGASYTYNVYSGNSLFDPDYTGVGHQPQGYDQIMTLFNEYYVKDAKITVNTMLNSTEGVGSLIAYLWADEDPNTPTNINVTAERCAMRGGKWWRVSSPGAKAENHSIICHNAATMDAGFDNPDTRGTTSASPAKRTYLHLQFWNQDLTTAQACYYDTMIEYDSVFFNAKNQTTES